jgi:hypothetical protein
MLLCVAVKPLIAKIPTIGLARTAMLTTITYPLVREGVCYSMSMLNSTLQLIRNCPN